MIRQLIKGNVRYLKGEPKPKIPGGNKAFRKQFYRAIDMNPQETTKAGENGKAGGKGNAVDKKTYVDTATGVNLHT